MVPAPLVLDFKTKAREFIERRSEAWPPQFWKELKKCPAADRRDMETKARGALEDVKAEERSYRAKAIRGMIEGRRPVKYVEAWRDFPDPDWLERQQRRNNAEAKEE